MSLQLAQGLRARCHVLGMTAIVCFAMGSVSWAHVTLDSPNGGESFVGGSTVSIDWHIHIQHNTLDWDVFYSIASDDGPWLPIAEDLPIGSKAEGTPYSFDWTVPSIDAASAWVRVIQDNVGMDYDDVSDASFGIATPLGGGDFSGDGSVNGEDLTAWTQGFGTRTGAVPTDGDADLDTDVDGADFLAWQADFDGTSEVSAAQGIPEPAATLLLVIGLLLMFCVRHW